MEILALIVFVSVWCVVSAVTKKPFVSAVISGINIAFWCAVL